MIEVELWWKGWVSCSVGEPRAKSGFPLLLGCLSLFALWFWIGPWMTRSPCSGVAVLPVKASVARQWSVVRSSPFSLSCWRLRTWLFISEKTGLARQHITVTRELVQTHTDFKNTLGLTLQVLGLGEYWIFLKDGTHTCGCTVFSKCSDPREAGVWGGSSGDPWGSYWVFCSIALLKIKLPYQGFHFCCCFFFFYSFSMKWL